MAKKTNYYNHNIDYQSKIYPGLAMKSKGSKHQKYVLSQKNTDTNHS